MWKRYMPPWSVLLLMPKLSYFSYGVGIFSVNFCINFVFWRQTDSILVEIHQKICLHGKWNNSAPRKIDMVQIFFFNAQKAPNRNGQNVHRMLILLTLKDSIKLFFFCFFGCDLRYIVFCILVEHWGEESTCTVPL